MSEFLQYTDESQTIVLWSNPPGRATVMMDGEPNALTGDKIKWDILKDRFEVIGLGGGGMPIGR